MPVFLNMIAIIVGRWAGKHSINNSCLYFFKADLNLPLQEHGRQGLGPRKQRPFNIGKGRILSGGK